MVSTPNLGLTLVEQSQAQKEITVNQALSRIDALMNRGAESLTLNAPPVSPATGDLYIVGDSPTGAWAAKAGQVAYFDAVWRFVVPQAGMTLWVADEGVLYTYDGTVWTPSGGSSFLGASLLSPVYSTDMIPVVRGGTVYMAAVSDCISFSVPGGSGGIFNFSIAGNSGLLGVI